MSTSALYQPRRRTIGLTALIDVVFILLMFFMLTTTFSQWRAVNVNTPARAAGHSGDAAQVVLLGDDGSLSLRGSTLRLASYAELGARHRRVFDLARPVVVVPGAQSSVQAMVATVEGLRAIGIERLRLAGPPRH